MHRQHSPPPTAPPVVPPPLPEEIAPPPVANAFVSAAPTLFRRVLRDFKIGGVCLLSGLIVGNSGLLDPARVSEFAPPPTNPFALSTPDSTTVATDLVNDLRPFDSPPAAQLSAEPIKPVEQPTLVQPEPAIDVASIAAAPLPVKAPLQTEPPQPGESVQPAVTVTAETKADLAVDSSDAIAESKPIQSKSLFAKQSAIDSIMTLASRSATMHAESQDTTCESMEEHGTVLKWADSPTEAYRLAGEQDKLVFMIHVSGNFEIPEFT